MLLILCSNFQMEPILFFYSVVSANNVDNQAASNRIKNLHKPTVYSFTCTITLKGQCHEIVVEVRP
jgi:hypothetical protein